MGAILLEAFVLFLMGPALAFPLHRIRDISTLQWCIACGGDFVEAGDRRVWEKALRVDPAGRNTPPEVPISHLTTRTSRCDLHLTANLALYNSQYLFEGCKM
jgi:hypothetical protein